MRKYTLIFVLLFLSVIVNAQLKQNTADSHFENERYLKSAQMYEELSKKSMRKNQTNKVFIQRTAQSYAYINQFDKAAEYYQILEQKDKLEEKDYVEYIQVLRILKRYPRAAELTEIAANRFPENKTLKRWKESQSSLSQLYNQMSTYQVEETNLNTGKGEFSPVFYQNGVLFATKSLQKGFLVGKYNWDQSNFLNLMYAEKGNSHIDFKKAKLLKDVFFTRLHDGPVAFDSTGNQMVITRNEMGKKKGKDVVRLALYFSTLLNDGSWTEPEPFPFNDISYSVGHASFSADQKGIYFVSDMPGGLGGTDIYYSEKVNGEWQKPVNLGEEINTELDEMFPYVSDANTLYFSSNGHFGLGGLDLFKVQLNTTNQKPINLGYPINSSGDDFSFIVDKTGLSGYFTSSREGFVDRIYAWKGEQEIDQDHLYALFGNIYDEETNQLIEGAKLSLVLNGENEEITTLEGKYNSDLLTNYSFGDTVDLYIQVRKEGYAPQNLQVTKLLDNQTELQYDFYLSSFELGKDLGKMLELNTIYYDLDKATLREESKVELDKVIEVLNENTNMIIELSSHTDCRQTYEYNLRLSERRAKVAAEYVKERIVNSHRVISKGYGELKLINDCACEGEVESDCTEEEHQENRRTEFIILDLD